MNLSKHSSSSSSGSHGKMKKIYSPNSIMHSITNEEESSGNPFDFFDEDYRKNSRREEEEEDEEYEAENKYEEDDVDLQDTELPLLDKIDTVKPILDHQDRLWKQIDILDDVKKMSSEINKNGTFFNLNHSQLLESLRQSQGKLLSNMLKLEKLIDESIYHEIWDLNIDETLDDEINLIKSKLFNKDQFTKINGSINEIKLGLDNLKKNIKIVDENSKDMWDNNDFSDI